MLATLALFAFIAMVAVVCIVAAISMIGFLAIYANAGFPKGPLRPIALADAVALMPLAGAVAEAWS